MIFILKCLLGGGIAGFLCGLLGIGGGSIIVPVLFFFFSVPIKKAIATSLMVVFISAISGFLVHLKSKNTDFKLAFYLIISGVIGAYIGAYLTGILPEIIVKGFFMVLLIGLGLKLLFQKENENEENREYSLDIFKTLLIGLVSGLVSGLCGVGGAVLLVPLSYMILKVPIKICVGTSLIVVFFNALSGVFAYAKMGFIDYRIGLVFGIVAIITSPIGAKISILTPREKIRKIFAVFLILMPILLLLRK